MSAGPAHARTVDPATRERVIAAVDGAADDLVGLVSESVRAASVTGREDVAGELYARWMDDAGFEVEQQFVDPALLPGDPALERELELERRPNVLGWLSRKAGRPVLALNGHMDVIPAGDGWAREPFSGEIAQGRVWGRGAADMKGGLAAGMIAARAVRDAGVELACDVVVQCVIAEETGGLGTRAALAAGPRPDAAIVLEPTDCVVASACGGVVPFAVDVCGRAAHTSVPWAGASAFERLHAVYAALAEDSRARESACTHPLFARLPSRAPLAVGIVRAGEYWGMIPDQARMEGRAGVLPGERVEDVQLALRSTVRELAEREGWPDTEAPRVTFPIDGFAAWETPADAPVTQALRAACVAALGDERAGAVTFGSDAAWFMRAGIPVVLFGPGRIADAHTKDEFVEIAQLQDAARVLAVALLECAARIGEGSE